MRLVAEEQFRARVRQALQAAMAQRPEARLDGVSLSRDVGRVVVTAVVRSPARFTPAEVGAIGARLPLAPDGAAPQLRVRQFEVDVMAAGH